MAGLRLLAMKFMYPLLLLIPIATNTFTQTTNLSAPARNAVYIEAYGPGRFMSINYDRLLATTGKGHLSAWVGGMLFSDGFGYYDMLRYNVHMGSSILFGTGPHKLELGLGAGTTYFRDGSDWCLTTQLNPDGTLDMGEHRFHIVSGRIGYRHQPAQGGLFIQGLLMPLWADRRFLSFNEAYISGIDKKGPYHRLGSRAELAASVAVGWAFSRSKQ